jgi:type I restriction enzyme, S subunit
MSATTKVPLSSVVIKTTGGGTPERDNPEFWNGGIPWASVKDFKDGIYRLSKTKEEISEKGLKRSASHLIPAGTPIICTRMAVGRIARASVPVAINQDLRALHIRDEFDTDYVVWAVDSIRHRIENLAIGSTVKGISIDQLLSFEIEAPNKTEQTKIAEILSTVDRAIEQTEALIAKQQRLKTGLMQDLLTRGIDEHGNLRSEQTHKLKDSPLGRIPVEWEVTRLESVSVFVTSGSRGWAQYYSTEGALFVRIGNLTRQHINMRFEDVVRVNPPKSSEGNRTAVMTGDLLISITADLGIIGVIPEGFEEAYVNQHISLVRLLHSEVDPRFVGWFLNSRSGQAQFEKLNESGAKAGLNLHTIKNLLIPKMEIEEQRRIAAILDAATQKGSEFQQRLAKLRALKTALMQDLLTGRKRVTELLNNPEVPA